MTQEKMNYGQWLFKGKVDKLVRMCLPSYTLDKLRYITSVLYMQNQGTAKH